jgi:Ca2+-binding EF-hand superfamily protein
MTNLTNTVAVLAIVMASASVVAKEGQQEQSKKRCDPSSFASIDVNKSNFITLEEFSQQKTHHGKKRSAEKSQKIFSKIDSNTDGEITKQEFTEHQEMRKQRQREKHSFSAIDSNNSGVITLEEFSKKKNHHGKSKNIDKVEKVYAKIDRNGDGEITEAEFTEHKENRKKRRCKKQDMS